jgi:hypothetical protein
MDAMLPFRSQRLQTRFPDSLDKKGANEYVQTSKYVYSDMVYLGIHVLRHLLC